MARTKKTPEPSYEKTCNLIYKLASARISQKYNEWKKAQPDRGAMIEIYPDRKLFGNVLNCIRTKKDNPYLLTLKLAEAIVKPLKFRDLNEVYWGSDPELYFEELFTTLLLEMQTYKDYSKYWIETPLATEDEIKDFYRLNRESILENKEIGNGLKGKTEYKSLKDRFIDFTYNNYDYFELIDEVGEFTEESSVDNREGNEALTFYKLHRKMKFFADKILLPFVSGICLNDMMDSFE